MNLEERPNRGTTLIPLESRILTMRKILLTGEINFEMVDEVFRQLLILEDQDDHMPIQVYIDSCGGEVDAGFTLIDLFLGCKTPVQFYCLGRAYSMAAFLFISGNHGRFMLPNSKLMLHEPLIGQNYGGSASDIKSLSEKLNSTKDRLIKLLTERTGREEEEIQKEINYDHFFTAEDAVEFGLCDKVVDFEQFREGQV